jgi:hypothetical protein
MVSLNRGILISTFFVYAWSAHGSNRNGFLLESDALYTSKKVTTTTTDSVNLLSGAVGLGFTFMRSGILSFRYQYSSSAFQTADQVGIEAVGQEFSTRVGLVLGKSRAWHLGAYYSPYTNFTLNQNESEIGTNSGWGYGADLAVAPRLAGGLFGGVKAQYRALRLGKLTDTAGNATVVEYSQSDISVGLMLSWRFNESDN